MRNRDEDQKESTQHQSLHNKPPNAALQLPGAEEEFHSVQSELNAGHRRVAS